MSDYISKADAIEAVVTWTVEDRPHEVMPTDLVDRIKALPSADADAYTRITGLVPDARPQMEHDREWIIGCIKHDGFIKTDRFDKANQIILNALSADAVQGYTEWLEKIIVDNEGANDWLCEDTPDMEWCEKNCHYSSLQAECLRHLYEVSKGGDDE